MEYTGLLYIYLLLPLAAPAFKGAVRDYCQTDAFEARCSEHKNEIIIMEQARYGRMQANRCATAEKGKLDCGADVLHLMDETCSGKQQCQVNNLVTMFMEKNVCDSELSSYLEASYSCVEVRSGVRMCEPDNTLFLKDQVTHLSSLQLRGASPTCREGRTMVALPAGQQLNITLIDLSLEKNLKRGRSCVRYGLVEDAQTKLDAELCGGQEREKWIWLSNSNRVQLTLQLTDDMPNYIIVLTAIGCRDVEQLENAHTERHRDTTTMICHNSKQRFQLTCKNNHWEGIMGNCTDDLHPLAVGSDARKDAGFLPSDIMVALIASAGFIICVAIIATGINCWRRNSLATQLAQMQERLMKQEKGMEEGADSEYMFPIYKGGADTEDALYDFCFTPANKNGTTKLIQVPMSATTARPGNSERMSLLSSTIERNLLPTVDENSMLVSQPSTLPAPSRSPPKESHYKTLIVRQNDAATASPITTTTTTSCLKAPPRSAHTLPPVPSPNTNSPARPMKPLPRAVQTLPPPPPPLPELDTPTESLVALPLPPPPPPITDEDSDGEPIPTLSASKEGSPVSSRGSTDSTPASALDNMATLPLRGDQLQNTISNTSHRTFTKTSDIGHMYAVPEKCLYENLKTAKKA